MCEHDPRNREQRRVDALGALAAGADRLACRCGRGDCGAGKRPAATPVVIHVIAEQATITGRGSTPASEVNANGLIPPELVAELTRRADVFNAAEAAQMNLTEKYCGELLARLSKGGRIASLGNGAYQPNSDV